MDKDTVLVFTRNGMGQAEPALQQILAGKFLSLILESGNLPSKVIFYTEGVKLACEGSPVLDALKGLEERKVELVLCKTCLDFFEITSQVKAGIVGGMGDILEAMAKAKKVISL